MIMLVTGLAFPPNKVTFIHQTPAHTYNFVLVVSWQCSYFCGLCLLQTAVVNIIGVSLSKPYIDHDNGPCAGNNCEYVSLTSICCTLNVPNIHAHPENAPCIPVYWCGSCVLFSIQNLLMKAAKWGPDRKTAQILQVNSLIMQTQTHKKLFLICLLMEDVAHACSDNSAKRCCPWWINIKGVWLFVLYPQCKL